jgi:uncharacterized membrane protein YhaH (DUF805 family)
MVAGEPFYRDLFRFSGRRRRGSYFSITLIILLQSMLVVIVGSMLAPLGVILVWLFCVPALIAHTLAGAQRCRDVGWTGWAVLLSYVPVIGVAVFLVLLFYPGTRGPNRYGPDPLASQEATPAALA